MKEILFQKNKRIWWRFIPSYYDAVWNSCFLLFIPLFRAHLHLSFITVTKVSDAMSRAGERVNASSYTIHILSGWECKMQRWDERRNDRIHRVVTIHPVGELNVVEWNAQGSSIERIRQLDMLPGCWVLLLSGPRAKEKINKMHKLHLSKNTREMLVTRAVITLNDFRGGLRGMANDCKCGGRREKTRALSLLWNNRRTFQEAVPRPCVVWIGRLVDSWRPLIYGLTTRWWYANVCGNIVYSMAIAESGKQRNVIFFLISFFGASDKYPIFYQIEKCH